VAAEYRQYFFSSRRRHTRCLSDWSSDVCSSDLLSLLRLQAAEQRQPTFLGPAGGGTFQQVALFPEDCLEEGFLGRAQDLHPTVEIGRASCRERALVVEGTDFGENNTRGQGNVCR